MKKLLMFMSFSFLLIIVAGCGSNEVNGDGPADIPVEWVNAQIQNNQSKMLDLLDEKSEALDPEQKAERKETIKRYKLTEWKVNDERYFYEVEFQDPTENDRVRTEKMEIVKTDSGWKRTKYGNVHDFDKLVMGLEPEVLRELYDE
ncbi:hypothetical protein [Heyndrickxia oleronia]|uniref:Lipoprotein n=1 Tax=Heyndrickxia oleronia TaxID=38875 RepID=A0AAW6T343_9BACI|nr:hypothetical protein [Heyndrickxia oleronia]MDH5163276.1 hypothetical protein [Heyndrickxia oleronia]GIN41495.1 hypothetical protein J19TS1_44440 [Heyndrickxia oleronia]